MGGKEASGKKKEGVADPGPTSLFLFTPSSPVRRLTTWFVNWPLFEWTIIITIIANCVVMALDDKLPYGDKTVLSIQMVSLSTFTQPLYNLSIVIIILGTVQKLQ
jgi:hypothetical protein